MLLVYTQGRLTNSTAATHNRAVSSEWEQTGATGQLLDTGRTICSVSSPPCDTAPRPPPAPPGPDHGLTLVHFSAQPEPFLTKSTP